MIIFVLFLPLLVRKVSIYPHSLEGAINRAYGVFLLKKVGKPIEIQWKM